MKKGNIILLTGKKQSGKDTVADFLVGKGYTKLSFAYELKCLSYLIFQEYFQIDPLVDLEDENVKNMVIPFEGNKNQVTYRQWLQRLGTEFFRKQISDTFWIDSLCSDIVQFSKWYKRNKFVLADVRFENEYRIIKEKFENEFDIVLIKIQRENSINNNDRHSSEIDIDSFDYLSDLVIFNNFDTKNDLYESLEQELYNLI